MRRVHLPELCPGPNRPDPAQAHHLRNVLRLEVGETVEAFDAAGRTAAAVVTAVDPAVVLTVDRIAPPPTVALVTVAAAVPKGDRADWMVEKLSEIGVTRFIPLRTARSVVHPEGAGKLDRWRRIAVEAAKQSRRPGVLTIEPLADVKTLVAALPPASATYFSTRPDAAPFRPALGTPADATRTLLIGPEGGWTDAEETAFAARGLTAATLGRTILRVETAALLAAGLAMLSDERP